LSEQNIQILIVDDERININALGAILFPQYKVSVALSGQQTYRYLDTCQQLPDLILLDVMMPEIDGYQVCQQLKSKEQYQHIPIIFISALSDPLDKVKGLECGAVDFISKPFNDQEVLARVSLHVGIAQKQKKLIENNTALLELHQTKQNSDEFSFNEAAFKISYLGKSVELTHLEFNLFNLLYNQPERIYSRSQILDQAYPDMRDISDRTVDAHVKNIRQKLKSLGLSGGLLESVYGAGYRYVAPESVT